MCLHDDKFKEVSTYQRPNCSKEGKKSKEKTKDREIAAAAITNAVRQVDSKTQTSTIIPVWVSSTKQPDQEVLVYALLDTQSDTTFILDEVAQELSTKMRTSACSYPRYLQEQQSYLVRNCQIYK